MRNAFIYNLISKIISLLINSKKSFENKFFCFMLFIAGIISLKYNKYQKIINKICSSFKLFFHFFKYIIKYKKKHCFIKFIRHIEQFTEEKYCREGVKRRRRSKGVDK